MTVQAIPEGFHTLRIQEPVDQFGGDRNAIVEDMAGNRWWIATHKEDLSSEELVRRAMESE